MVLQKKEKVEQEKETRVPKGGVWGVGRQVAALGWAGLALWRQGYKTKAWSRKLADPERRAFWALEVWRCQDWRTLCRFQAMWLLQGRLRRRQDRRAVWAYSTSGGPCRVRSRAVTNLISISKDSLYCCVENRQEVQVEVRLVRRLFAPSRGNRLEAVRVLRKGPGLEIF